MVVEAFASSKNKKIIFRILNSNVKKINTFYENW